MCCYCLLKNTIELLAVVNAPAMNGSVPDSSASGFLPHPWSQDSITVNICENPALIHVHNIEVGNMDYDYLDTDTVTRMLFGINVNSESNPYILYVGSTLDLFAVVPGSFSVTANGKILHELDDKYLHDITAPEDGSGTVETKTKYLAITPGKCQIAFT